MESEKEWQFIINEIQNKTGSQYNEWFIGLKENSKTQRWTWINGKSLTIDKWYKEGTIPTQLTLTGWFLRNIQKDLKEHLVPLGATYEE